MTKNCFPGQEKPGNEKDVDQLVGRKRDALPCNHSTVQLLKLINKIPIYPAQYRVHHFPVRTNQRGFSAIQYEKNSPIVDGIILQSLSFGGPACTDCIGNLVQEWTSREDKFWWREEWTDARLKNLKLRRFVKNDVTRQRGIWMGQFFLTEVGQSALEKAQQETRRS